MSKVVLNSSVVCFLPFFYNLGSETIWMSRTTWADVKKWNPLFFSSSPPQVRLDTKTDLGSWQNGWGGIQPFTTCIYWAKFKHSYWVLLYRIRLCLCPGNIHLSVLRFLVHCLRCSKLISFHSQGNSKYPVLWEDCKVVHFPFPVVRLYIFLSPLWHFTLLLTLLLLWWQVSVTETTNLCLLVLPKIQIHCCLCLSPDVVSAL